MNRELVVQRINQTERAATIVADSSRLGDKVTEGLSILVFVVNNSIAKKAVNMALFLARYGRMYAHDNNASLMTTHPSGSELG